MSAIHAEAAIAGGYVVFLVAVAFGLEALARHSHNRALRFRTAGFDYLEHLDLWVCPEGEQLHRHETDHGRRIAKYRARARVCNACALKHRCTDADTGREILRPLDPWPHSESGRFHRGLCLVPVALAGLILVVAATRNRGSADLALLLTLALPLVLAARYLLATFIATPSGFPAAQGAGGGARRP
jgi:hypothetical protein